MGSDFGSCDIDLSELQHELSSDTGWEEAIRLHLYRNGIKVFDHDMFLLWLDKFVISLKAGGTISKDRKGFMEHFRNWISTEIKRGLQICSRTRMMLCWNLPNATRHITNSCRISRNKHRIVFQYAIAYGRRVFVFTGQIWERYV